MGQDVQADRVGYLERPIRSRTRFVGRVSSNPQDAGYQNFQNLIRGFWSVRLFLNGVEIGDADTADSVEGFVDRFVVSKNPTMKIGQWPRERLRGEVEIRIEKYQ